MTDPDFDAVWAAQEEVVSDQEIAESVQAAGFSEVVCRKCAGKFGQITEQHVQTHGLSLAEYTQLYPEASIYPEDPAMQPGREDGFEQPPETRREISESLLQNPPSGCGE